MKQHITKEQWDQLSETQKLNFDVIGFAPEIVMTIKSYVEALDRVLRDDPNKLPNIGQMIEFLGDDLSFIEWNYSPRDIKIVAHGKKTIGYQELCDVLWEAVKEKLKEGKGE